MLSPGTWSSIGRGTWGTDPEFATPRASPSFMQTYRGCVRCGEAREAVRNRRQALIEDLKREMQALKSRFSSTSVI